MRQGQRLARNDHSLAATTQRIAGGAALGQRLGAAGAAAPAAGSFGASTARTRPLPVWLSAEGVAFFCPSTVKTSVRVVVDDDGARDFVAQGTAR